MCSCLDCICILVFIKRNKNNCCCEENINENTKSCPKCGSTDIVRIPDNPNRHASGNNIYTSTYTLFGKIPVIRYVCCSCGYAENWVENEEELEEIRKHLDN